MRSEIYAVNTTVGSTLTSGSTYAPATIVRRFGQNVQLAGNGVVLRGSGYYNVDASVTVTGTAAGTVTATILQDGQPISGATATATVAAEGSVVTLAIPCVVRLNCCDESLITVAISGETVTTNNLALRVGKE